MSEGGTEKQIQKHRDSERQTNMQTDRDREKKIFLHARTCTTVTTPLHVTTWNICASKFIILRPQKGPTIGQHIYLGQVGT